MLDSSLIELPPISRPLKRSASVASLPTPPRTRHKRKHASRSRSRRSDTGEEIDANATATDSDESDNDSDGSLKGHKKRKLSKTEAEREEEEDAFWTGSEPKSKSAKTSSLSPAPILYRQRHIAPVSPPPSTRKTTSVVEVVPPAVEKERSIVAAPRGLSPPVTPKPSTSRVKAKANPAPLLRDSPGNPFLDSPFDGVDDDTDNDDVLSANGSTSPRTPPRERPTLTYVFRGVRTQFANPLYNHTLSPSALLPPSDPEFSPDPACPPRLLFPSAHRRSKRLASKKHRSRSRSLRRSVSPSPAGPAHDKHEKKDKGKGKDVGKDKVKDTDKGEPKDEASSAGKGKGSVTPLEPVPEMLPLTFGNRSPRTRENSLSKVAFLATIERGEQEKDDPIRRALGPVRR